MIRAQGLYTKHARNPAMRESRIKNCVQSCESRKCEHHAMLALSIPQRPLHANVCISLLPVRPMTAHIGKHTLPSLNNTSLSKKQ